MLCAVLEISAGGGCVRLTALILLRYLPRTLPAPQVNPQALRVPLMATEQAKALIALANAGWPRLGRPSLLDLRRYRVPSKLDGLAKG
jgi:hypothetical protein